MRRTPRIRFALAILVVSATASAASADPVLHLAWDDCGAAGVQVKTFACNANVGAEVLYVSFVPPAGIDLFDRFEGRVQLMPANGNPSTIPSWWDLGGCRSGALLGGPVPSSGPFSCADPFGGAGAGGAAYSPLHYQLLLATASPTGMALDPGTEYYAGQIVIRNSQTVGAGACGGCSTPLGLYVSSATLYEDQASPPSSFIYPDLLKSTGTLWSYVTWQCPGSPIILYSGVPNANYSIYGWDFSGCVTGARRRTWGGIKSLYR